MSKYLKAALNVRQASTVDRTAVDKAFQEQFPALFDFLTLTKDHQGHARETASLSVFCQDGQFKCVLNERQEQLSLWVSVDRFEAIWTALEAALTAPNITWRSSNGKRTRK